MKICQECDVAFVPKRKEQRYCSRSCASVSKGRMRRGQKTGPRKNWTYARYIDADGYVKLYARLHPYCEGRLMAMTQIP